MALKYRYLLFISILFPVFVCAQNITLKGKVIDAKTKEALIGANIRFDGRSTGTATDANGDYSLSLSPGHYKVKVKYIGYEEYEKEIDLTSGSAITLNIPLNLSSKSLQSVSIYGKLDNETESASRANEKNSNNIKNVISAQAIAKSPDINAANVLQRVSGVTIQRNAGGDDAYPILRGIEPRYNNTLINGVKIASPDSKSRFVSLSIVPADLLQRIEVDKSLLPEMEGDAIGGTVNLVFKDAPDNKEINASASVGYSQLFFDRNFIKFQTQDIQKFAPDERFGTSYQAQPNDFSRTNLDFKSRSANFKNNFLMPTTTFTVSYGDRFLKNKKIGFLIGNSFQDLYFGSNSTLNTAQFNINDPEHRPQIADIVNRAFSTHQILNNLVAHLDYRINDKNKIALDNVILFSHLEETAFAIDTALVGGNGGRTIPGTGPVSYSYRSTTTNQLLENIKLNGNHILSKHFVFDWTGAFSLATTRNPDQATIQTNTAISYTPTTGFTQTPQYFDGIPRIWQHNDDRDISGAANLTYSKLLGKDATLELKAGGLYRHKNRDNYESEYDLRPVTTTTGGKAPFYDIYSTNWIVYNPYGTNSFNDNDYTAFENISAIYGQFKLSFPKLDIFGGIRSESTNQSFYHRQVFIFQGDLIGKTYTDLLPSLQLKYKLNAKTNIRASYFASISRPAYYELVPVQGTDNGGTTIKGNQNLLHTTADNFDVRYEFFPNNDEQFFIGTYYKKLTNPIENELVGISGASQVLQPTNIGAGKIAGIELTLTRYLGAFGVSGNYAYNYSVVKDSVFSRYNFGTKIAIQRRLSGASVHDLNVSLLYRNIKNRINAQLAYQYLGSTVVQRYEYDGDIFTQKPLYVLAFSADAGISKHFTIYTKLNNLLNSHTVVSISNFNSANEYTKTTYLLGLRYNY